jgi:hypothetical protein
MHDNTSDSVSSIDSDESRTVRTDGGEQTVVCYGCGAYVPRRQTEDIDVSPPDEYYPDMRALCPDCSGDGEDDAQLVTDGGEDVTRQTYSGYLVINWRDDDVRFRKTAPSNREVAPTEIAIPVSVGVTVPEVEVPEITAEVEVPAAKVEHAVADEQETDDVDRGDGIETDGGTAHEPITELQSAVVWYHEEGGRVKHEGHADLYPNWVRLGGGIPSWVPRDRVEVVMRA